MENKFMTLHEALMMPSRRKPARHLMMAGAFERWDSEIGRPGEVPRRFAWEGQELTMKELSAVSPNGISPEALRGRLATGWTLKKAMNDEVKKVGRRELP